MKEKLLDLMKHEGLKPSQLAEILEVNPAGISHILAGRNKPGFDLLQKILRRFPQINPDWLLLDSPQMYRDEHPGISQASAPASTSQLPIDNDLFGSVEAKAVSPKADRQETGDYRITGTIGRIPVSGQPNRSQRSAGRTVLRRSNLRKFRAYKALKSFTQKISRNTPRMKS